MQNISSTITINTSLGRYFFQPDEIVRLEACNNYTKIYFTNKKKMLTSKVLKEYARMLEPLGFVRTHRTHLVNRQHVAFVSNKGNVIMKDESVAEVSRRMKTGVMKALNKAA